MQKMKPRIRFAPSPTGALHIGGIRTALYNYLFARKMEGTFILRIEDTDQARYVPGAEAYIIEALEWCGLLPDEGPGFGGEYGPYRQSERKDIYLEYAEKLVASGNGYYAFDTPEELDAVRQKHLDAGNATFQYDAKVRLTMNNSLTLPAEEVARRIAAGDHYIIRLKVPEGKTIHIHDIIRGDVSFNTSELDDKVMLKSDGMPTYHLANVVDDHLMKITHVIRGEEWLPSTAHHVLLYQAMGWESTMPQFAHLPLILKPNGQGKLSKRDGLRLGIPVFPLSWKGATPEDSFTGFRETGFDPKAMLNFLLFLGWNPGTEQEIFTLAEMASLFTLEKVHKAGARFDYEKAKWFNQQYILHTPVEALADIIRPFLGESLNGKDEKWLQSFCRLLRERVTFYEDFVTQGNYLFHEVQAFDEEALSKKWKPENKDKFLMLAQELAKITPFEAPALEARTKEYMAESGLKPGDVFPVLRIALTGAMHGPGVFDIMELLGVEKTIGRLHVTINNATPSGF